MLYEVNQDSTGNAVLKITYDSFHLVTKSDDKTTIYDASNGIYSIDPVEKMLAFLKGNSLFITLNKQGKMIAISGYKEISDKLVSAMDIDNETERKQVQDQIAKLAGENFIKIIWKKGLIFFLIPPFILVMAGQSR